jgi:hypothetical protein
MPNIVFRDDYHYLMFADGRPPSEGIALGALTDRPIGTRLVRNLLDG